ncbi:MAG: hypothetical protein CVU54_05000 [Deltaproteobacteria bacterium HGW-Deltaproteobacteria-12]|jgi:hypothetical protein|nr:MAG: hypothetical protein CVU54_05000 [Deltaproteobacteria bacterium HGW-Deltaproteobacteria-12]
MKKKLISILSIIMIFGMFNMVNALTIDSQYVMPGEWTEMYIGGHPGANGNKLDAQSYDVPSGFSIPPYIEWSLSQLILDEVTGGNGVDYFITDYTGGALTMSGFSPFTDLAATVFANIRPDYMSFGTITMTGSNGSFILSMTGDIEEIGPLDGGHWGMIFITELNIEETTAVPEPASLLLFGLGLIGIAGIGRKFKK